MGFLNGVGKSSNWHLNLNDGGVFNCLLGRERKWLVGLATDTKCLLLLGKLCAIGVL